MRSIREHRLFRAGAADGFTVVEVVAAMAVLVIGLLGAFVMLDTANGTTSQTMSRESGTTLARDILERARQVPYQSLGTSTGPALVRDTLAAEAPTSTGTNSWTIRRRNVTYAVTVTTCKIDDSTDGIGPVSSSYCSYVAPAGGSGAGGGGGAGGISLQLLGIPLSIGAGGSLVSAVCALIGQSATLDGLLGQGGAGNALLKLVGSSADVQLCPGSGTKVVLDDDPDDMTRVTATVNWTAARHSETLTQSTLVPNAGTA
jgi:Tfp pilus assembly protein PilV